MKITISLMLFSFILIEFSGCTVIFVTDPSEVKITSSEAHQDKDQESSDDNKFDLQIKRCDLACKKAEERCALSKSCKHSPPVMLSSMCIEACINNVVELEMLQSESSDCELILKDMKKFPEMDWVCGDRPMHERWIQGCVSDFSKTGICIPTPMCKGSEIRTGFCPGTADIACCVAHPCADQSGVCLDADQAECEGEWVDGLCPGKPPVRCCRGDFTRPPERRLEGTRTRSATRR